MKALASSAAARMASMTLGLASANFVVVKNCPWESGPPMIPAESVTRCAPGTSFSS